VADTYTEQADANVGAIGTGAMTLAEAAIKEQDYLKKGVLELFVDNNPVLARLPFMDIEGNSYMYDYETALPSVGFRAVTEGYSVSHGRSDQRSVGLAIFGGDLDVDRFIIKTRSSVNDQRALQEAMQVKAMSLTWLKYFFDGDRAASSNEEFDGVNVLLGDAYHSAAVPNGRDMDSFPEGGVNGWYAVDSLVDVLDEALDDVIGGNSTKVILANKTTRRWLNKIARQDGQISIERDQWGYQVMSYAGVPIVEIETDAAGTEILGFDETQGTLRPRAPAPMPPRSTWRVSSPTTSRGSRTAAWTFATLASSRANRSSGPASSGSVRSRSCTRALSSASVVSWGMLPRSRPRGAGRPAPRTLGGC